MLFQLINTKKNDYNHTNGSNSEIQTKKEAA